MIDPRTQAYAALAVCFALLVLLLRTGAPISLGTPRRERFDAPGLLLELPVQLTAIAVFGAPIAAALCVLAHLCAVPVEGRARLGRRVVEGALQGILWLCAGWLAADLFGGEPPLSLDGFGAFTALFAACIFVYLFAVAAPLRCLGKHSLHLIRLWRALLVDTRRLSFTVLAVAWSYACTMIWIHAGSALGLASFLPLPFLATALRALHNQRLELHRLRLARDAVQAMLRTRDPLPQMNSLLSSLHTPSADETLQIFTVTSSGEPTVLASMGGLPEREQNENARSALAELARSDRPSAAIRTQRWSVSAYAVRAPDDHLLGALIVHRSARTASLLPARRFARAASELAPLLRDFRAIAATQDAASLDALTGLPNRRAIMEHLRAQIDRVSIESPCALLILDIDHFKNINDALGHQAGDHCLRTVAQIVARNIRSVDRAGRIGGEEFVILMPETDSDLALTVGERLRGAIEAAGVHHAGGEPVTASIGVAVASLRDTLDSLLARADRALYEAKRQGRNRVIEIGA